MFKMKLFTKKIYEFILLAAVVVVVFVCSFNYYAPKFTEEYYRTRTTIVFWTLQLSSFDKYINNIILEFEKENPDIKVKWIDVPYSEGEKRTLAAILTDNPPDLVNLTPDFSLLLAQKNALYNIPEEKLKSYVPEISKSLKYNDKFFGVPFYATSAVTLYNDKALKEEDITELPFTYDELFTLKPKKSYLTMINFSENDTLLKLLNKYDINSPSALVSDESVKLFETFKSLYNLNLIPKESVTQTHRDSLEKYMSGKLIFLVTGANFLNMIEENASDIYKNTKILPQLTGSTGKYDYSLMNFVIPVKSKNPEAALKFALYFTNKKNQLDFAKMTPILPVNYEALADDYFSDNTRKWECNKDYLNYLLASDKNLQTKARMISAYQLNYLQQYQNNIKNKKELNTISSNYIQQILIKNTPVKETLYKFSLDWEKL